METNNQMQKKEDRDLNLTDPFFGDFFSFPFEMERSNRGLMKTDVKENDNNYELKVEVPGFDKSQINVSLDDGYLTISAHENKNNDQKNASGKFIRRERFTGSYERSFYVGSIDQKDIAAKLDNGVLTVTFPKEAKEDAAKKLIEIK
jgi:HSP20 family protein